MKQVALLVLLACAALAADDLVRPDRPGLDIVSEEFEFRIKEKTYVYRHNVVVTNPPAEPGDPPTILKCQILTGKLGTNGGFETIVAEKDVRISQGDQYTEGSKAVYTRATEELVIYSGDKPAMLAREGIKSYGDRIIYSLTNSRLRIDGAVRTEISGQTLQGSTNSPGIGRGLFPQ